MPIKRGRKAETLAAAAAPTPASEEDENAAWEARIADEAGGGDPLDVWIKYIRWWQDRCVAGGPVQQLLPVLERCAFAFKEDPRYTDDARYLRVWISYADLVRDAEPIFDYLYGRRIGETHTLFWESWAAVLEAKRKLNAADKVFSRGIQMRAQPDGRLRRAHEQFQGRMMRRIMKGGGDEAAPSSLTAERF